MNTRDVTPPMLRVALNTVVKKFEFESAQSRAGCPGKVTRNGHRPKCGDNAPPSTWLTNDMPPRLWLINHTAQNVAYYREMTPPTVWLMTQETPL